MGMNLGMNWMPVTGSFAVTANELLARRGDGERDGMDVGARLAKRLRALAAAGCGDERLLLHIRALPPREGGARAMVTIECARGGKARETLDRLAGANALFADKPISDLCMALEGMLPVEWIEGDPAFLALFAMEGLGYGLTRASVQLDDDMLGSAGEVRIDDPAAEAIYRAIARGLATGGLAGVPDELPAGPHMGLDTRGGPTRAQRREAERRNKGKTATLMSKGD